MAENDTSATAQQAAAPEAAATSSERPQIDHQLLEDVIDAIRPSFQADGGDLERGDHRDDGRVLVVHVRLRGHLRGH